MIRKHLDKYAIAALRIVYYYNKSMTKQDIASVKYPDFVSCARLLIVKPSDNWYNRQRVIPKLYYRIQNAGIFMKYLWHVVLVDHRHVVGENKNQ